MKETKLEIPAGCEVDKIEAQDGHLVVTFKDKEWKLPKSWEEFCKMYDVSDAECFIDALGIIRNAIKYKPNISRNQENGINILPDRATAEAVIALCQLIQLRNCYNGDWVPDWKDRNLKFVIHLDGGNFTKYDWFMMASSPLFFKTLELRDQFLKYFRPLIEKLKPLYGIKEGGEE